MLGSGRRLAWTILILGAAGLAFFGVAIAGEIRPRRQYAPMPAWLGKAQTSKEAYTVLAAWMSDWHPDAAVVSCTTSQHLDRETDEGWTFQVYAPANNRIALVKVAGQQLWVLRELTARYPVTTLPDITGQKDSDEVLKVWWEEDGRTLWQQSDTEAVHLRLGPGSAGAPTWQITLARSSGQDLAFTEFDAVTGQRIQHTTGE
jgi:hypothetical protein